MTASAVVVHEDRPGTVVAPRPAISLLRPIAEPSVVLASQEETRTMITQILQSGRDFGVIPGTDKPSMLKPGAERVALAFGCYYGEPIIVEKEVDHDRIVEYTKRKKIWRNQFDGDREFTWEEVNGTSRGLYRYVVRVDVINRATDTVVGSAIGSCSTMESKYIDRPRDSENTALKMAHKRALVGACLITFGLSDQFTQDTEDMPREVLQGEGAPKLEAMDPPCPVCKGKMWDNRLSKKKSTHPDFKCKNAPKQKGGPGCEGVIWPPKEGEKPKAAATTEETHRDFDGADDAGSGATDPLVAANAVVLPGSPTAWGGKGGSPLSALSSKMLASVRSWCLEKIGEAGTDLDEAAADQDKVRLVRAIDVILPARKAAAGQGDLGLTGDPVKDAAAQKKSVEGEQRPDPTAAGAASSAEKSSPKPAARATTKATTPNSDGPTITQLTEQIQQLLQSTDRTPEEKDDIRKRFNAAKTFDEMQAIATDLSFPV